MIEEKRQLSAEFRKTAHDGEFEFKVASEKDHSLSHEEAVEKLHREKKRCYKKFYNLNTQMIF